MHVDFGRCCRRPAAAARLQSAAGCWSAVAALIDMGLNVDPNGLTWITCELGLLRVRKPCRL